MQFHSYTGAEITVRTEVIRHIKDVKNFEEMLETKLTGHENVHINIFANISKMESSIARFIMYYSMLHDLYKSQKNVDKFIIQENPEVKILQTERPGKDFGETIYTYIRNQISHLNNRTNIEWVQKQVQSNLLSLQQLTKRAIKKII